MRRVEPDKEDAPMNIRMTLAEIHSAARRANVTLNTGNTDRGMTFQPTVKQLNETVQLLNTIEQLTLRAIQESRA